MKWKNTFNDNSDKVNNEIKKGTEYQSTSRLFFIFRRSSKFSIKKGLKFYSQSLNLYSLSMESRYHPFTTPRGSIKCRYLGGDRPAIDIDCRVSWDLSLIGLMSLLSTALSGLRWLFESRRRGYEAESGLSESFRALRPSKIYLSVINSNIRQFYIQKKKEKKKRRRWNKQWNKLLSTTGSRGRREMFHGFSIFFLNDTSCRKKYR